MPAKKTERWHELKRLAEAEGVEVDGRWSEATLEDKVREAQETHASMRKVSEAFDRDLAEMHEPTEPIEEGATVLDTTGLSSEEKTGLALQLRAKLVAMQPGIVVAPPTTDVDADIAMLTGRIEKIQKEQLGKELEMLGVAPDPKWSIERFHEEIERARVPSAAPPGINVVQVGVDPNGSDHVVVQCIVPKVHLGDAGFQTLAKMQKAMVTAELADLLEKNEQCVKLQG